MHSYFRQAREMVRRRLNHSLMDDDSDGLSKDAMGRGMASTLITCDMRCVGVVSCFLMLWFF